MYRFMYNWHMGVISVCENTHMIYEKYSFVFVLYTYTL